MTDRPDIPTEEIGYGWTQFEGREWDWLDRHTPKLQLRCQTTGDAIASVWHAPDRQTWYRSLPYMGPVAAHAQRGLLPIMCPTHKLSPVPLEYIEDQANSSHKWAVVLCTDPTPVYRRP